MAGKGREETGKQGMGMERKRKERRRGRVKERREGLT